MMMGGFNGLGSMMPLGSLLQPSFGSFGVPRPTARPMPRPIGGGWQSPGLMARPMGTMPLGGMIPSQGGMNLADLLRFHMQRPRGGPQF